MLCHVLMGFCSFYAPMEFLFTLHNFISSSLKAIEKKYIKTWKTRARRWVSRKEIFFCFHVHFAYANEVNRVQLSDKVKAVCACADTKQSSPVASDFVTQLLFIVLSSGLHFIVTFNHSKNNDNVRFFAVEDSLFCFLSHWQNLLTTRRCCFFLFGPQKTIFITENERKVSKEYLLVHWESFQLVNVRVNL